MPVPVYKVKTSRQEYTCDHCKEVIPAGGPYIYWTLKPRQPRHRRCSKRACYPKPWELEHNPKRQAVATAAWNLDQARMDVCASDASSFLADAISAAEDAADQLEESAESVAGTNLENAEIFGLMAEHANDLREWVSSAEEAKSNLDDADPDWGLFTADENVQEWAEALMALDDVPEGDW